MIISNGYLDDDDNDDDDDDDNDANNDSTSDFLPHSPLLQRPSAGQQTFKVTLSLS